MTLKQDTATTLRGLVNKIADSIELGLPINITSEEILAIDRAVHYLEGGKIKQ